MRIIIVKCFLRADSEQVREFYYILNLFLKALVVDKKNELKNFIDSSHLYNLGFEGHYLDYEYGALLKWLSENKADIIVIDVNCEKHDRLEVLLRMITDHFCNHIVLVASNEYNNDKYSCVSNLGTDNSDLKLAMALLTEKKKIEARPARNETVLRSKICEMLCNFMFSSKHDGFKYYVDAIMKAYSSFPFRYSTMDIYKDIAVSHKKTACAVEKSMRTALYNAYNKLKDAPVTPENMKLKSYLTYDMNNNMAISMMVSRLVLDKELNIATNDGLIEII